MMFNIENQEMYVSVNSFGAELSRIKSKRDNKEIIWNGCKDIWSKTAPILFPIVGKVKNDCYMYNGKTYHINKHGFALKSEFELISKSKEKISLALKSSEETKLVYPFDFMLTVEFELNKNTLIVNHIVLNMGNETMLFSIGAHPGFNCSIGDYLEFEKLENISAYQFDDNKIIKKEMVPFLDNENIFTIKQDTFNNDALILENLNSSYVYIKSNNHKNAVKMDFGKVPFLGIWAKPGAPYVCIEPWYGIDDDYQEYGELGNKKGIQSLKRDEIFSFKYKIEILGG